MLSYTKNLTYKYFKSQNGMCNSYHARLQQEKAKYQGSHKENSGLALL